MANVDFAAVQYRFEPVVLRKARRPVACTDAIMKRIRDFHAQTKAHPQRIVIFRDGLSEGEFMRVRLYIVTLVVGSCNAQLYQEL